MMLPSLLLAGEEERREERVTQQSEKRTLIFCAVGSCAAAGILRRGAVAQHSFSGLAGRT